MGYSMGYWVIVEVVVVVLAVMEEDVGGLQGLIEFSALEELSPLSSPLSSILEVFLFKVDDGFD